MGPGMSRNIPIGKIVDFAAGRLSREESLALLEVIEHDRQASQDLELIASLMDVVEKDGEELFEGEILDHPRVLSRLRSFASNLLQRLRAHPVLSGAAAFAVVFAAVMLMLPMSSPYGSIASVRDFDFGASVRGVELEEFAVAFELYRQGRFDESARQFERYLRAFPRSEMSEYAHYAAGAAYLQWSEWRLGSVYIGYDRGRVQEGMKHLDEVVQTSRNLRLLEDVHWLRMKGYLMISDPQAALEESDTIVRMGRNRREAAEEMIRVLHSLQQSR